MKVTVAQKMLIALRCFSCQCRMEPPLYQSTWGLQYCSKCAEKSSNCSQGHSPQEFRRDYLSENMCFESPLKCSYSRFGCTVTGNAVIVAEHETSCAKKIDQSQIVEESQLKVLLSVLECPVCYERVSTPISQCIIGHQICNKCFAQLSECPVCRGPKSDANNLTLELICWVVEVPCNYAGSGCKFREQFYKISDHEESCTFIPRSCPLIMSGTCNWQGITSEVVEHCKTLHCDVISLEATHQWVLKDFLLDHRRNISFNLFYIDDILFRCNWCKSNTEVAFSINCMEIGECKRLYSYEIDIFTPDGKEVASGDTNECTHLEDGTISVVCNFVVFSLEYLQSFCSGDNYLIYDVRIAKIVNE